MLPLMQICPFTELKSGQQNDSPGGILPQLSSNILPDDINDSFSQPSMLNINIYSLPDLSVLVILHLQALPKAHATSSDSLCIFLKGDFVIIFKTSSEIPGE